MKVRSKITFVYLFTYGPVIIGLCFFIFFIFKALEYRRIDNILLTFHNDIVKTYTYSEKNENTLLSLVGDENLGFAIYENNKTIASFRIDPSVFKDIFNEGEGTTNNYRYKITFEKENDSILRFVSFYQLEKTYASLSKIFFLLLASSFAALAIISVFGTFFTKNLLKPIEDVGNQLEKISRTGLSDARVKVNNSGDEVVKLQQEINKALERIERLVKETKQMSSKIAHELRTPLSVIKSSLQLLQQKNISENVKIALKDVLDEIDDLIHMSEDFLLLANVENSLPKKFEVFDLSGLLLEAIEKIMILYPEKDFDLDISPGIKINGIKYMIERVIINLLDNAAKYSQTDRIEVKLYNKDSNTHIEVINAGDKINIEEKTRYMSNLSSRGFGLGLRVVRSVVNLHKAHLGYEHINGKNHFEIIFRS
ncbi:MAG: HAMP domain-containing sensor histidine kinase [Thermotogota bacterium]|nr:HAMP domain-containing sensor histidine kinase [Thermotogota bacterium]